MPLLLALALLQQTPPEPPAPEIVVTARPRGCSAWLAGRSLSDARLNAYARDWAKGVPVRIRAPSNADYRCLAKIAFKLGRKGVRLIEFVRPSQD